MKMATLQQIFTVHRLNLANWTVELRNNHYSR